MSFHVYCDAFIVALGVASCQPYGFDLKEHPIPFASWQLTRACKKYSTTNWECLAIVFSVKKFRHELLMNSIVFFVNLLAIRYMVITPNLSGRVARWILFVKEVDYIVE